MSSRKNITIGITINLDNYENLRLEVAGEADDAGGVEELIAFLDTLLLRLGRGDAATAERVEAYRRRVIQRPAPPGAPGAARARAEPARERPVLQAVPRPPSPPAAPPASARAAAGQPAPPRPAEPAPAPVRERPPKTAVLGVELPPSALDEIVAASEAASASRRQGEAPARALTMEDVVHLEEDAEREAALQPPPAPGARKAPAASAVAREREAAARAKKPAAPPVPETGTVPVPPPEAAPSREPEAPAGDVICQECGAPVGKSQQKLSQLFMGKILCRKCMNP
ncbi:MAG: hypothetical protein LUQ62_06025 [Methanomicrobiales archaeon]|nr:hypothetical protein [Methanomicrobiales archaeon]